MGTFLERRQLAAWAERSTFSQTLQEATPDVRGFLLDGLFPKGDGWPSRHPLFAATLSDPMRHRDALLFAATGWDPTWQRRLSAPARAVWAAVVGVLSTVFCAALLLAWLHQPPDERWMLYVLAAS